MGLEEFDMAARMRDVITSVSRQVIDSARPAPTYGTVVAIDRLTLKASVSFPGEASTVKVGMNTIQPNAVGQIVRIEGVVGDRYITDVIGGAILDGSGFPVGGAVINAKTLSVGPSIDINGDVGIDHASMSYVNSQSSGAGHQGPSIKTRSGMSIYVVGAGPAKTKPYVFGVHDIDTSSASRRPYAWAPQFLVTSTNDGWYDAYMPTTQTEGLVTGGTSSGISMWSRTDDTRRWAVYPTGTTLKVWASNPNKVIMGMAESGLTWISRGGHALDANGDLASIQNHTLVLAGNAGTGGATWNNCQLNIRNTDVSGDASLSLYCSNYATAPIMRNYGAFGEIIDFVNNGNTGYITIRAAAFTVVSSGRFKTNIRAANPLLVGDRSWTKWAGATKRLQPKVWKKLPTVHTNGNVHQCGRDCDKSLQNPCPIGVEDQRDHLGFVAEEVALVFPEAVTYDLDGAPYAIDYTRLTAALWGAVAELTDRVEALESRPLLGR